MTGTPDGDEAVAAFIRGRLPVVPVPDVAGIVMHKAEPGTGVGRWAARGAPPYWAYWWAGGLALARHLAAEPGSVAGVRVLDLGAGGGLIAIAAARAGASHVTASECDPDAQVAIALNAGLNGVRIDAIEGDLLADSVPAVDVVLVGDLFYDAVLTGPVLAFLDRCLAADVAVLVGDPGRAPLPTARLRRIADYPVRETGTARAATVFELIP
ncbi:class I SAM-dependent methyltransferase [Sphingomonas sp. RS6]